MTKHRPEPTLTPSEERILRSTIDDPQLMVGGVPVRTVKKMLALIDLERRMSSAKSLQELVEGAARDPVMIAAAKIAHTDLVAHEPILATERLEHDELIDIPTHVRRIIEEAVWSIKRVHPDVDAWLTELTETASSVDFVERELVATLVHAFTHAPGAEAAAIPDRRVVPLVEVRFIPVPSNPAYFTLHLIYGFPSQHDEFGPMNSAHAAAHFRRPECVEHLFNVTRILPESGATAQTTRPGSEIADMLERGALP